mgnify:CR=1 FL=1
MAFVKIILLPLSVIYGVVTGVRNFLFHIGILKSQTFRIPVICVGNITVGGTGKTPHTELIISELKKKFRVACLSRGYKRKTRGFILANEHSTAAEIGDEPMQIKSKYPDILVACERNPKTSCLTGTSRSDPAGRCFPTPICTSRQKYRSDRL